MNGTDFAPRQLKTDLGSETKPRHILVIGGTTFIGKLLVEELVKSGHQVDIFHRRNRNCFGKAVTNLIGDRNDAASIKDAVGSIRYDAVYDFAYDWDRGTTGKQVEATAQIFDGRTARYVFLSSVAAYGDGLNHHEGDALAPDDHDNAYARNKATSERALFRLHQKTGFPVVTLRPPFVYGPGNPYYREVFFWDRMRSSRPVILPSDGHRLMQFIYVNDLVEMAIKVMEPRNFAGHAFNTANPRPVTQHELMILLGRAAGKPQPEMVSISRETIQRAGGKAVGDRLYFGDYYDLPAITEVVTKAQRMLGFKPTDFLAGLKAEYQASLAKRSFARPDFTFEDHLLRCAQVQNIATRSA